MTEIVTELAALAISAIYIVGRLSARMDSVEGRLRSLETEVRSAK
jgi:hypothetical protein